MTEVPQHVETPAAVPATARWWPRAIAWAVCLLIVAFVVRALWTQFAKVDWSQVRFDPARTAAAVACLFAVSLMQLIARWTLLLAYGYPLPWRVQVTAAWVPQIGKYLPGGIASVGGTVYLLRKQGVPAAVGLSVAVLLDALAVMAGLIVCAPLLLWRPVREALPLAWLACIVLTGVGIVLLHPRVFVGMLNFALIKLKRQPIAQVPPIRKYLWPVLASFGQWLFAGLGLWFMTGAITTVSTAMIPLFIASAALAMTVSYLAPFAPGGAGVREGVFLLTLKPLVGGPAAAIVAVAMRIVQTLIEVLLAAIGTVLLRGNRTKN